MYNLSNVQIKKIPPERVYTFPDRLTKEEIGEKVNKLHTIAKEDADRTIYCLFDEVVMNRDLKFEVCFPISHLDLSKYNIDDFKVLERGMAVCCEFDGDFSELSASISELTRYANDNGYTIQPPYRYLFILHKKPMFSKQPQKFTMEVHIPIIKA